MSASTFPLRVASVALLVVAAHALVVGVAQADCGSVPFSAPFEGLGTLSVQSLMPGQANVKLDPLNVVVYEPGQRAIILWNGKEEILLLSTELKTSDPVNILEVIPLPAKPTVRLGEFETFEKMQKLLVDKTMWKVASGGGVPGVNAPASAVRIEFHELMGAHDLTVAQVLNRDGFVEWVKEFLEARGAEEPEVRPEFAAIVANYLDRGFRWFAFDVIRASDEVQSRQPIEYRFESDAVFYPLEISSLETGKTNIDLLVVTREELDEYPVVRASLKRNAPFSAASEEIRPISAEWAVFMGPGELRLQEFRIKGRLHKMKTDFVAK